jgi:hypothetical protein
MVGWSSIFDYCGFVGAEEVVKAENVICFGERVEILGMWTCISRLAFGFIRLLYRWCCDMIG